MFRSLILISILSLFFTNLVGCEHIQKTTHQQKNKGFRRVVVGNNARYFDDGAGISIEFPVNWDVKFRPSSTKEHIKSYVTVLFTAESPFERSNDAFRERIGVVVLDLDEYQLAKTKQKSEGEVQEMRKQDLSLLQETGFVRIQGLVAAWHISKTYAHKETGRPMKQMGFDIQYERRVYKIGWVGEASAMYRYKNLFWRIAQSFQIEGMPLQ